jgi:hypothetical protein
MRLKRTTVIPAIMLLASSVMAQVGIGLGVGALHPGLQKSQDYESRFAAGPGFELFARHTLAKLGDDLPLVARYQYRNYANYADLPFTAETQFVFTYLTVDAFIPFKKLGKFQLYAGGGFSLVNATAQKDFLAVTESLVMPEALFGVEYAFNRHYNVFAELMYQHGSIPVREDQLPLSGLRFMLAGTMFLTE